MANSGTWERSLVPLAYTCVFALSALAGCDERLRPTLTPVQPGQPGSPSGAGATPPPSTEYDVGQPLPAILANIRKWDAASPDDRKRAAERADRRLGRFKLVDVRTFRCGQVRHDIAVYEHAATGLEFSLIPGGTFRMGSPSGEEDRKDDEVQHKVTISEPFLISRTEVTQAAWRRVLRSNPSKFPGAKRPVEKVSQYDVNDWLRKARLKLPTEAQWEYACRGGSTSPYCFGKDTGSLAQYAWYDANAGEGTHEVGRKKPNAFGLFDMHGNVFEWCRGGIGDYPAGHVTDPEGDENSGHRPSRGGSWSTGAGPARSAFRYPTHPSDKHEALGFRPVRVLHLD